VGLLSLANNRFVTKYLDPLLQDLYKNKYIQTVDLEFKDIVNSILPPMDLETGRPVREFHLILLSVMKNGWYGNRHEGHDFESILKTEKHIQYRHDILSVDGYKDFPPYVPPLFLQFLRTVKIKHFSY